MKGTSGITIFASSIFVPVLILGMLHVGAVQGVFASLTVHSIAIVLIVLSGLAAWAVAMRGFLGTGSTRLMLIGTGFLAGTLLLALHGFFVAIMNQDSGIGGARAEWYLRLGMLIVGVFLFLTIGFAERTVRSSRRKLFSIILSLFAVALAVVGWWLGGAATREHIVVAASAGLWTPLGRFIQIASILLLVLAAIRYLHGAFLIRSEPALAFATGIVLLAMSELTYAAVQISYDSFFWMAHLWIIMGFLSFLWGSMAAGQVPHSAVVPETGARR